jgi:hypothetical protein
MISAWSRLIKKAEPKLLHWTDPIYQSPATEAPLEFFKEFDILCPNRPMCLYDPDGYGKFFKKRGEEGQTLHFYSCAGPVRDLDTYSYYRLQAWHCFEVDAKGNFFWAFGDNGFASSWNEYLAKNGTYSPLFIDSDSVTLGKRMEAVREGVEDYETLVMLKKAIANAEKTAADAKLIAEAKSLLKSAAPTVLNAPDADKVQISDKKDRTIADQVRVKLLKMLERLGKSNDRS